MLIVTAQKQRLQAAHSSDTL